jgi:hypothetical protein
MPTIVKPDETIKVPGVKPRTTSTGTNIRFNPFRFKIGKNPFHEKVHTLNTSSGQPQIKIPVPGEGLPRVIHFCADQSGCGFWRMLWPAHDLLAYNKAVVMNLYQMVFDPRFYGGVDAVRVQRQATDSQLEFMKFLRKTSNR